MMLTSNYRHFARRLLVVILSVFLYAEVAASEPIVLPGDWTVTGKEWHRGKHIRLDGSLILPEGSELTLEDCTLDIIGDYSREHSVEWKGGRLVTHNCTIGGFVNDDGISIHTVFHLYEGHWEAVDTTVQYSYGISFHWIEGRGVLRGTRLKAGRRPDAIILSGEADVKLIDSDFPIGLGVYVDHGGTATLDLEPNKPVTATYDRSNLLPGVNWRLEMRNTRVKRWFVFVRDIGMHHDPAEITLKQSEDLILSLLGHNLTGEIELSNDLIRPLAVGNVTLKAAEGPVGISMYAIYLSGDKTDVSVTGNSHICELMHRGGKLRVIGTPTQNQISIGCTTLELSGNAQMEIHNVHMGRPLTWREENSIGEATIAGNASLTGSDITVKNVRFHTKDEGSIRLTGVERRGKLEQREGGGEILIELK